MTAAATTTALVRALGRELHTIRKRQGMTRAQLIAEMGSRIATQTLASWEDGSEPISPHCAKANMDTDQHARDTLD
ncbi:MAG: hypothetical protein GEU98_17070 [Pseudonocardiaceae bacterium]|nr:hypothetical protein [Pseudonocardiaceae bacterium]